MISIGGAVLGLILGGFISWLQQEFGLISLGDGSGSFVVDAYPVKLLAKDFLIVFLVVLAIGFLVAWYPVKQISKKISLTKKRLYQTINISSNLIRLITLLKQLCFNFVINFF